MGESDENTHTDVSMVSGKPSLADLHTRLSSLEEQIGKHAATGKPWWQRLEFIGPVFATIITAIVSLTTVTVQEITKNRELALAKIQQQAVINQNYLDRALDVHDNALKREFALDFYSQVVQDASVRDWAIGQLAIMRTKREAAEARQREQQLQETYLAATDEQRTKLAKRLENASQETANLEARARDTQRSVTIDNLIATDRQARWQAAEDLSTIWGNDPDLPAGLLRFIRKHSENNLAIYNVVVVLEDLVKCCVENLKTPENLKNVEAILGIAFSSGGEKARGKVENIRGALEG